jgi:hypothetical protein
VNIWKSGVLKKYFSGYDYTGQKGTLFMRRIIFVSMLLLISGAGCAVAPAQDKQVPAVAERHCPVDAKGWQAQPQPVDCVLQGVAGPAPVSAP